MRQEIIGIDSAVNNDGRKYCRIELNPEHIFLEPRKQKPFQGWRYLKSEEAPVDFSKGAQTVQNNAMPAEMVAELKELGLF